MDSSVHSYIHICDLYQARGYDQLRARYLETTCRCVFLRAIQAPACRVKAKVLEATNKRRASGLKKGLKVATKIRNAQGRSKGPAALDGSTNKDTPKMYGKLNKVRPSFLISRSWYRSQTDLYVPDRSVCGKAKAELILLALAQCRDLHWFAKCWNLPH